MDKERVQQKRGNDFHDLKVKKKRTSTKINQNPNAHEQSYSKKSAIVSKIAQWGVRLPSKIIFCFWGYFFG
jgi:hypothetical protein